MEKMGILLLHGFAGNPDEVGPLREFLAERGYRMECPLLPGHGETKSELSKTSHEDWILAAEQAYHRLSKECESVVAVGFSMGGLLAANLWNYKLKGFVTVNTPVFYWNPKIIAANLFSDFGRYRKKYLDASTDKSLSSLVEFLRLLAKTKPMFGNITCRTLVVQALDDDTVHYKSADYILKKVRAEKTVCLLPKGGHMIFYSKSGSEVCKAIERFLEAC
jgi:carboxylesterase